jgi:UDP-N-acetyl-D-glucosamine dehydrogenase
MQTALAENARQKTLIAKINSRTACVGVIGLGYVGLPLALEAHRAGYNVIGFDVNESKIATLRDGKSYITDIPDEKIHDAVLDSRFAVDSAMSRLGECDIVIICVPTPLKKASTEPELSYLIDTVETIAKHLRSGQLIVLESTTYPGTTRDEVAFRLERSGLRVGEDMFLAFSPERVDPGNPAFHTQNIPKIVGGMTAACSACASAFYNLIVQRAVVVSSPQVAEMAKILENTYRLVNIALINETAQICNQMGIDIWEVIEASGTKPFGFQKFYPGPGVGGHCIPIDPLYFKWVSEKLGLQTKMIDLAQSINEEMPAYVAKRVVELLAANGGTEGARVLVLGAAYKKDVNDVRESTVLQLIEELQGSRLEVDYHDPYIERIKLSDGQLISSVELSPEQVAEYGLVVIHTDHSQFDYQMISGHARLIFDTRNVLRRSSCELTNVVFL